MKPMSLILAAALVALSGAASAEEFTVEMLNRGEAGAMVFEPAFIRAEPGDVIHFVPTDRSHDVASIEGMLPDGVEPFESEISEPYDLTVTEPGIYGVKCTPHFSMGMVMLIQVGDDPANLEAAQEARLPRKAGERMEEAFALVE
jgi:pseudoazurin